MASASELHNLLHSKIIKNYLYGSLLILFLMAGICIIAYLISTIIGKKIIIPLSRLHQATERIAAGDLDHRIGINTLDEIGQLSISFDQMTQNLKESRKVSRENYEKYKSIFESTPISIVILDKDGFIIDVNQYHLKHIGMGSVQKEALIGLKSFESPSIVGSGLSEKFKNLTTQGISFDEKDIYFPFTTKGDSLWLNVRGVPLRKNGFVSGAIIINEDITIRKKMENQIRASLKEKEILLREIHHRVKNNMTIIYSLLELQAKTIENKQERTGLNEAKARIKTMAFIHEKLYRSKDLTHIDFQSYIRDAANSILSSYMFSNAKIGLELDIPRISLKVDDAIPCGLIMNELMTNSLKHAFPKRDVGYIKIAARLRDDDIFELTLSDDGIGIPDSQDETVEPSLGLKLVDALAKQLQGTFSLYNDKGTIAILSFRRH